MSYLPTVNPVNSVNDADLRKYVHVCMEVRCNIEDCANTCRGVKAELAKLSRVIGHDAEWLISMYGIMSQNAHHGRYTPLLGNMEWIKEVDIAVKNIMEKLRR